MRRGPKKIKHLGVRWMDCADEAVGQRVVKAVSGYAIGHTNDKIVEAGAALIDSRQQRHCC